MLEKPKKMNKQILREGRIVAALYWPSEDPLSGLPLSVEFTEEATEVDRELITGAIAKPYVSSDGGHIRRIELHNPLYFRYIGSPLRKLGYDVVESIEG